MEQKMKNKTLLASLFLVVALAGCSTKGAISKNDLETRGCEAFNFDSLLLSKAHSVEFVDFRSADERNFQNGLWTTKEYCDMSRLSLTELIVKYGEKTRHTNIVTVGKGKLIKQDDLTPTRVEIQGSKLQYQRQEGKSTFNFVAANGKDVINFKEGDHVKLDGVGYRFYNKREYKNAKELWQIEIIDDAGAISTMDLNQNKFMFGSYKIIF